MFYVYVYKDPRPTNNKRIVYVGKGIGDRAWQHWKKRVHKNKGFGNFLALLRRDGYEPIIELVVENVTEEEAFAEEIRLIALYGRRNLKTGFLFNLTDGGEGPSGHVRTKEQRANDGRFSKEHWQDPGYRAKVIAGQIAAQNTPEALTVKSENSKALWQQQPDKMATSIKAARNTEESKAKTSAQAKAQWADPEYAAKQTANNKEIANREEVKAAKKAAAKALWADPVWKAKMLAARKAKKPLATATK